MLLLLFLCLLYISIRWSLCSQANKSLRNSVFPHQRLIGYFWCENSHFSRSSPSISPQTYIFWKHSKYTNKWKKCVCVVWDTDGQCWSTHRSVQLPSPVHGQKESTVDTQQSHYSSLYWRDLQKTFRETNETHSAVMRDTHLLFTHRHYSSFTFSCLVTFSVWQIVALMETRSSTKCE